MATNEHGQVYTKLITTQLGAVLYYSLSLTCGPLKESVSMVKWKKHGPRNQRPGLESKPCLQAV